MHQADAARAETLVLVVVMSRLAADCLAHGSLSQGRCIPILRSLSSAEWSLYLLQRPNLFGACSNESTLLTWPTDALHHSMAALNHLPQICQAVAGTIAICSSLFLLFLLSVKPLRGEHAIRWHVSHAMQTS